MPTYAYIIALDGRRIQTVYTQREAEGLCRYMLGATFTKRSLLQDQEGA